MCTNEMYACLLAFVFSQYIRLHYQISTIGNHALQVLLGYASTLFNDTATCQDHIAMVMYEYITYEYDIQRTVHHTVFL